MDEIQAAVLLAKALHLKRWATRRLEIATAYTKGFTFPGRIDTPQTWEEGGPPGAGEPVPHSWHAYVIRVSGPGRRENLAGFLAGRGIQTTVRYPVPLHLQPALRALAPDRVDLEGPFPEAEALANQGLCLPIYPEMTDKQAEMVIEAVSKWAKAA